jgi:hypothetical protein
MNLDLSLVVVRLPVLHELLHPCQCKLWVDQCQSPGRAIVTPCGGGGRRSPLPSTYAVALGAATAILSQAEIPKGDGAPLTIRASSGLPSPACSSALLTSIGFDKIAGAAFRASRDQRCARGSGSTRNRRLLSMLSWWSRTTCARRLQIDLRRDLKPVRTSSE